eukprot:CAMPEP_0119039314 /NCGR_PEP_ID=MMETSP1177-20130426/8727_1 /TAXON_ID=2985 /ORGANISM="Ochromonas sp, Strain CCMP1899" /LENGTH=34 /DNA_ID= /DNA_START= /DNA_END= /DNA_ORIENTATION=
MKATVNENNYGIFEINFNVEVTKRVGIVRPGLGL